MAPRKVTTYYTINVSHLKTIDNFTYLGVQVHEQLKFSAHILKTISKGTSTLYILICTLKSASHKAEQTAYFAICFSLLEYASEIWNPSINYLISGFEKVNRKLANGPMGVSKSNSISGRMYS